MKNKHEFALYYEELEAALLNSEAHYLVSQDKELCHRIATILRLKKGEEVILFNHVLAVQLDLEKVDKNECTGRIINKRINQKIMPEITALVPVLKREDLEEVVYHLTAIGVTTIQLIMTEKVHRGWTEKELGRLKRIIISAAEQAKCFSFALLQAPIQLNDVLNDPADYKIFADPQGKPLPDIVQELCAQHPKRITLLVGPEGDLTEQEKNNIRQANFVLCRLTPTVLRSAQAMALLAGICQSLYID